MNTTALGYLIFGAMTGLAIGVACEAIAGARERLRQRNAADNAIIAAYAEGLHDGRRSARTVTLGPEVATDEA